MLRTTFLESSLRRAGWTTVLLIVLIPVLLAGGMTQGHDAAAAATGTLFGDVNGDGVINIIDVQLVAAHWNTRPGDPGWNIIYDLNGDGVVDVTDLLQSGTAWNQYHNPLPVVTHCGSIIVDESWEPDAVHRITCGVTVQTGVTLTLLPGTVVKFNSSTGLTVNGALVVSATVDSKVVFTSLKDDSYGGDTNGDGDATSPAPGDWVGIRVEGAGSEAQLDHAVVKYGGSSPYYGSVRVESGALTLTNSTIASSANKGVDVMSGTPVVITGNRIEHNRKSGLYIYALGSTSMPTVTGNAFSHNNVLEGMPVVFYRTLPDHNHFAGNTFVNDHPEAIALSGTFESNTVLRDLGMPYVIFEATVPAGQELIVEPGVVIKFGDIPGTSCGGACYPFIVYGGLLGQGTSVDPIVFTSLKDDSYGGDTNGDGDATSPAPGDWQGLSITQNGSANIRYVKIMYGVSGIYSANGNVSVSDSAIANNASYGIYNTNYYRTVQAENNWWGSDSGPAPYGSGNGINFHTYTCGTPPATCYDYSAYVDVSPWVGQQSAQSNQQINNALPPAPSPEDSPATSPAFKVPGVPYIVSLKSNRGNSFIVGYNTPVIYDVLIDWNGSNAGNGNPGTVRFTLNGVSRTVIGTSSGASRTYFVGSDLRVGQNTLRVVAVSSDGVTSPVVATTATVSSQPSGTDPTDPGSSDLVGDGIKYRIKIKIPEPPLAFEADLTGFPLNQVPWIGGHKLGIPPSQARFDLTVRNNNSGNVMGQARFGFGLAGQQVFGTFSGEGDVLMKPDGNLKVTSGVVSAGVAGTMQDRRPVLQVIPAVAAISNTPVIGPLINKVLDRLYFKGRFEPEVQLRAGFENANGFRFTSGQLSGATRLTLALGADVWTDKLSVEGYGGGRVKLAGGIPAPYFRGANGELLAGVTFKAWRYSASAEKPWPFSIAGPFLDGQTTEVLVDDYAAIVTDWHVIPRTYITDNYHQFAAEARVYDRGPDAAQALYDELLVSNIYPLADPALIIRNDAAQTALLAWVYDDPAKPIMQGEEIVYSVWNGMAWSTPAQITSDTYFDNNPRLAFDGAGHALVVWERLNDPALPSDVPFDTTLTKKSEIAYAVYDLASGLWSAPALLTNNMALDYSPRLSVGSDGRVMLTWLSSPSGELLPVAGQSQTIYSATWDGTAWSPVVMVGSFEGLLGYNLAYRISSDAVIVLVRDMDGDVATAGDQELFYTTWNGAAWSAVARLTTDTSDDANPTVLYGAAGSRRLVWLKDETVMLLDGNWSLPPVATTITDTEAMLLDLRVVADPNNNLALIWQGQSDAGPDIYYSLYDDASHTWRLQDRLTNNLPMEKSFAPAFNADGELWIGYARDEVLLEDRVISPTLTISNVVAFGQSDLHMLRYTTGRDLKLADGDLVASQDNPGPGETVVLSATVRNTGDFALENVALAFYDGDPAAGGVPIGAVQTLDTVLIAGESHTFTTNWVVPSPAVRHMLYAVADPVNAIIERSEVNNTARLAIVAPDIQINDALVAYYPDQLAYPLAVIANVGPVTAENVLVQIVQDTITGTMLFSSTIASLAPNAIVAVTTTVNTETYAVGEYPIYFLADPLDAIVEGNEENNTDVVLLKILPDLVVLAGDVITSSVGTNTGIAVTIRNRGVAAAGAFTVTIAAGLVVTDTNPVLLTLTSSGLALDGITVLTGVIPGQPTNLYAIVDRERILPELDKANNVSWAVWQ